MRRLSLALLISLCASPALAEPIDHRAVLDRALEQVILPAFRTFAQQSETLAETAKAVCNENSEPDALRALYANTYAAWMAVDAFRLGPVEERHAALSINFWPDKKNFVGRGLRGLQAATADQLSDPAFIESQSAAVQGLPALERLIVDGAPCPLAPAISAHIAQAAQMLTQDWAGDDGWADVMREPGEDNPIYLSSAEASADLYKALQFGLQSLSDARLGRPLGTINAPRPKRAEAWRSDLSRANIIAQFQALQRFYQIAFGPVIDSDAVDEDWRTAEAALKRMPASITQAVTQPAARLKVEVAKNRIDDLRKTLGEQLAPRLGIAIGFNSADGD